MHCPHTLLLHCSYALLLHFPHGLLLHCSHALLHFSHALLHCIAHTCCCCIVHPRCCCRFEQMLTDGYFEKIGFYRVIPGFLTQFGIAGANPQMQHKWDGKQLLSLLPSCQVASSRRRCCTQPKAPSWTIHPKCHMKRFRGEVFRLQALGETAAPRRSVSADHSAD